MKLCARTGQPRHPASLTNSADGTADTSSGGTKSSKENNDKTGVPMVRPRMVDRLFISNRMGGQDQKKKRLRTGGTARLLLLQVMLSSALLNNKQA